MPASSDAVPETERRPAARTPSRSLGAWALALAIGLTVWVFASPLGASPDEPAHMATAWGLATGQNVFDRPCDEIGPKCSTRVIDVPAGLIPKSGCHQFRPDITASCLTPHTSTEAPTYQLRYPPLYYGVIGFFLRLAHGAGLSNETVGYLARLMSAALTVSLLAPAATALSRAKPTVTAGVVAAVTPTALFLSGSVNPNGVEIAAAITVAAALVVAANNKGFGRRSGALLLWGLLWLAWVRPLGWLWSGALLSFGSLYVHLPWRAGWQGVKTMFTDRVLWASSAIVVASMGWFVFSLGARNTGAGNGASMPESGAETALAIALRWGGMTRENIGVFGWLDTPLPNGPFIAVVVLLSAVLTMYGSADGTRSRRRITVAYLVIMIAGITGLMWRQDFLWQGRYALPVLVGAMVLWAGAASPQQGRTLNRLASLLWATAVLSALWVAARYSYGIQPGSRFRIPNLSDEAQWFGPLGDFGLVALCAVSLVGVPLLLRGSRIPAVQPSALEDAEADVGAAADVPGTPTSADEAVDAGVDAERKEAADR